MLSLSAAACSSELNGWDRVKWGQGIDEVKIIYKDTVIEEKEIEDKPRLKILELEQTKIEEIPLDVTLLFLDDKLSESVLSYVPEGIDSHRSPTSVMEGLKAILTYSYGEYDLKNENLKESDWYDLVWFEGKTKIILTYQHASGVTVMYEKRTESSKI